MDGISQGLVANLITTAVERVTGFSVERLERRRTLDTALAKKIDFSEAHVKSAIDDLHVVIGSMQGGWTNLHERFFAELRRTQIPSAMFVNSLSGDPSEHIKVSFLNLFRSFSDDAADAENFYCALKAAIDNVILYGFKDKAIILHLSSMRDHVIRKLNDIELQLSSTKTLHTDENLTISFREKYCNRVHSSMRYVPVETERGQKKVDISRIFVSPLLAYSGPEAGFQHRHPSRSHNNPNRIKYVTYKNLFIKL